MLMNHGGAMTVCDEKRAQGGMCLQYEDGFHRDLRRETEPTAEGLDKEG